MRVPSRTLALVLLALALTAAAGFAQAGWEGDDCCCETACGCPVEVSCKLACGLPTPNAPPLAPAWTDLACDGVLSVVTTGVPTGPKTVVPSTARTPRSRGPDALGLRCGQLPLPPPVKA